MDPIEKVVEAMCRIDARPRAAAEELARRVVEQGVKLHDSWPDSIHRMVDEARKALVDLPERTAWLPT